MFKQKSTFSLAIEEAIDNLIETEQGFSISVIGDDMPSDGYMVGGFGFELRIKRRLLKGSRLVGDIADMLARMEGKDGQFVGGWLSDSGDVCIDISECIKDKQFAIEMGIEHNQDAIYDIERDLDIKLR